jgi:hypothetical protein
MIKNILEYSEILDRPLSSFESNLYSIVKDDLHIDNIITNILIKDYKFEIDFLFPDYHIGIECNGIRYHTRNKRKMKDYHKRKRDILKEEFNYNLYNIFSDQFRDRNKILLLLKKKFNQLEDISNTIHYDRQIIKFDINTNKDIISNYLYLNFSEKKLLNIDYYVLFINHNPYAIMGIDNSSEEYIKITRFNYIYHYNKYQYYSKTLELFIEFIKNDKNFRNKKYINITIDNGFFTGKTLKSLNFNIIQEIEPIPKIALLNSNANKDSRKGVTNLKKILKSKTSQKLIWDCGKTTFQLKL